MSTQPEITTKHPQLRLIFSAEEISRRVGDLAKQISADYKGRDLLLIGVLKGAFIFLADLARQLTIPAEIEFVRLASYGTGTTSTGKVNIISDVKLDVKNRDLLIVEDIIDSGLTLDFLRRHLLSYRPKSLKICAFLDKAERRSVAIPIDYLVLNVPKGFLVGYGLDCNERHRHLKHVYEITP